jgi:hypothetical protein
VVQSNVKVNVNPALNFLDRIKRDAAQNLQLIVEESVKTMVSTLRSRTPVSKPSPDNPNPGALQRGWRYSVRLAQNKIIANISNDCPNDLAILSMLRTGTKPHPISPRFQKMLRFYRDDQERFSNLVHHPGTKPSKTLLDGVNAVEQEIESLKTKLIAALRR